MDANKARELMKKEKESKHETELRLIKESKGELEGFFVRRNYKKRLKKLEGLIKKAVGERENRVQYDNMGVSTEDNWLVTYKIEDHFSKLGYVVTTIEYKFVPTFLSGEVEYISIMIQW